jgi:uncharacterized protein with PIN domain
MSEASISKNAFNCPYCGTFTSQSWHKISAYHVSNSFNPSTYFSQAQLLEGNLNSRRIIDAEPYLLNNLQGAWKHIPALHAAECFTCSKLSIWKGDKLIWPQNNFVEQPNADMPEQVKATFAEACSVVDSSPRAAAALARLAIQQLCEHLGTQSNDLNTAIGELVQRGLDRRVQQALDSVRVIGNSAVHPGKINIGDRKDIAIKSIKLVNLIVQKMISDENELNDIYEMIPEDKRKAIEKRDGKQSGDS